MIQCTLENKVGGMIQKKEDLPSVLRTLDKLKKIGEEGVRKELEEKGFSKEILKNAKILSSNRIKEIVGILNQNKLATSARIYYSW